LGIECFSVSFFQDTKTGLVLNQFTAERYRYCLAGAVVMGSTDAAGNQDVKMASFN
jgi:hypothetical protein